MFPIRDHNPSGRTPFVTLALIAINVVVFLGYFTTLADWDLARFFMAWGMVPARILDGQGYETLVTHMFLHGGWMHIIGNMLFLWIFGDNLEDEMGHLGFCCSTWPPALPPPAYNSRPSPGSPVPMVGASGAIAGVMGGYLLMFPRRGSMCC